MTKGRRPALLDQVPKVGALLAISAIAFLLSSCDSDARPTPISQAAPTPPTLQTATLADPGPAMTVAVESVTGILGQLVSAQSIAIKDDWSGLGVPTTAHYSLTRSRDAFEGTGEFTVQSSRSASVPVMVPLEVAQDFLSRLARVPLVVGEYAPDIEYSDDYPSFSIDIQVNNQLVSVYSQSQFGEHIPWGADISGEKYTINSGIPAEALGILSPYLKHDETISNLIEEIRQEDMQNTPAP